MRAGHGLPAIATILALLAGSAQARDELQDLLDNIGKADDPTARRELVSHLASETVIRAAERLRDIVRTDPDPTVRAAAAAALGTSSVPECTKFLLELLPEGGPHEVRRALARSLA